MASTSSEGKGSFKQKLGTEELAFFNQIAKKPFSEQAVAFLNAYWEEVGHQAEFIFNHSWAFFKAADMHFKGCEYLHLYNEGLNLDFDAAMYFFEQLGKHCDDEKNFKGEEMETFKQSFPSEMTAIVRKKELRSKVDVNFDGKVSFIEYLLYQYQGTEKIDPLSFITRSMNVTTDEPPEITEAKKLLAEIHKLIAAYEKKKMELEIASKGTGVKALAAKNSLAQLGTSPEAEELNKKLITAEAKVRIVMKKYGIRVKGGATPGGKNTNTATAPTNGAVFWMDMDLKSSKKRYKKGKK